MSSLGKGLTSPLGMGLMYTLAMGRSYLVWREPVESKPCRVRVWGGGRQLPPWTGSPRSSEFCELIPNAQSISPFSLTPIINSSVTHWFPSVY